MMTPTKPQKPRLTDRNRKKPNLLKSITKNEAQKEMYFKKLCQIDGEA